MKEREKLVSKNEKSVTNYKEIKFPHTYRIAQEINFDIDSL